MSRSRAANAVGRKLGEGPRTPFRKLSHEECLKAGGLPSRCHEAWCNHKHLVFLCHEVMPGLGTGLRLMVRRLDGQSVHSWCDLQCIKDELAGEERTAVEIYPPKSEIVDDANIYHLWVFPEGKHLGFGL